MQGNDGDLGLTGSDTDRPFRNRLNVHWLARECAAWIKKKVELRGAPGALPQSLLIASKAETALTRVITGNCSFSTEGLGITPGNQFSLIQCSEGPEESATFSAWFTSIWNSLPANEQHKNAFLARLQELASPKPASLIYYLTLFQIFKDLGDELDEERIVKSATGIRNTTVWKKLYKFQRDGVIGAIDKLERLGGCIIADSVGLGKTFEALAIIKYYELRNDRVLVLVPKRLRDNWTLYKANDRRNFLASDRFNYDVLNHTDLQNAADDGNRRVISIQLPEPTDRQDYPTISAITRERLRRAGKKIREKNSMFAGDLGFRVFKLASSNIRAWDPKRDDLPTTLEESIDHLKSDRTEQDILFELLLKLGLDLTVPIDKQAIAGKAVHSVGAGTLLACMAEKIAASEVEPLALGIVAWHKTLSPAGDTTIVFRDSAFANDVSKTNLTAILQQHGLENVRSL